MIPKKITNSWLRGEYACADQRKLFREVFPTGMPMNLRNLRKARQRGLYVVWLADRLSDPIRADYDAKVNALWAEYDAKVISILMAAIRAEWKTEEGR